MRFNLLPEDVLLHIFEDMVLARDEYNLKWQYQFTMLAICANWRHVLLPYAYRKLFCSMDIFNDYDEQCDSMAELMVADSSVEIVSNASLYIKYYVPLAKRLDFVVSYKNNPYAVLKTIINTLKAHANVWHKVSTISINTYYRTWNVEAKQDIFTSNIPMAYHVSREITRMFPNIKEIDIQGIEACGNMKLVCSNLIEMYANKLSKLTYGIDIKLLNHAFSSSLTKLCLTKNAFSVERLPIIYVDELVCLELYKIPYNFDWNLFKNKDGSGKLTFSKLRQLKVQYSDWFNDKYSAIPEFIKDKMHFPALKQLEIEGYLDDYELLDYCVFPEQLNLCKLSGNAGMIHKLTSRCISQVSDLAIVVDIEKNDNCREFISYLNKFIANINIEKSGILHIYSKNRREPIDFGPLHCPGLTELVCSSLVSDEGLLQFISQANNLRVLKLAVKVVETMNTAAQLEYDRYIRHRLQPYNSKLESLYIKNSSLDNRTENMLKYALLRLSRVKRLYLYRDLYSRIESFIEQYLPVYPHLANIKISSF